MKIKPLQIAPENAGNRISEALKSNIFRGSMSPDPSEGLLPSAGVYPNPPSSNPGSAPGTEMWSFIVADPLFPDI